MLINTGTIPVIVLSSRTPIGNRDAALKAGAIAYIHKPVDVPVLLKAINDALGISPTDAPPSRRLHHPSLDSTRRTPHFSLPIFDIEGRPRTVYTNAEGAQLASEGMHALPAGFTRPSGNLRRSRPLDVPGHERFCYRGRRRTSGNSCKRSCSRLRGCQQPTFHPCGHSSRILSGLRPSPRQISRCFLPLPILADFAASRGRRAPRTPSHRIGRGPPLSAFATAPVRSAMIGHVSNSSLRQRQQLPLSRRTLNLPGTLVRLVGRQPWICNGGTQSRYLLAATSVSWE